MADILANTGINISGFGTGLMNFVFILVAVVIIGGLTGLLVWKAVQARRYRDYYVRILEVDSFGKPIETKDRAGIFYDRKTGYTRLWLKKNKIGLNANNPPYITEIYKGKIYKIITLQKTGEQNYKFIKIDIDRDILTYTAGAEDVNQAVTEYEKAKRAVGRNDFLEKYAPFIMFALTIMIFFIIVIVVLNKMESIAPALEETAKALKEAAQALPQSMNNTMILN